MPDLASTSSSSSDNEEEKETLHADSSRGKKDTKKKKEKQLRKDYFWLVCGQMIDMRVLQYCTKIVCCFSLLTFACGMIYKDGDTCSNHLVGWYCGIVGSILGILSNDFNAGKIDVSHKHQR